MRAAPIKKRQWRRQPSWQRYWPRSLQIFGQKASSLISAFLQTLNASLSPRSASNPSVDIADLIRPEPFQSAKVRNHLSQAAATERVDIR